MKNYHLEKHLELVKKIEGKRINLKTRLAVVHDVFDNLNQHYDSIFYQHYVDTCSLENFSHLLLKKCNELIPFLDFYIEYSDHLFEKAKVTKAILMEVHRKATRKHMKETIDLLEKKTNQDVALQILEYL
jgi:hypothetical protein